MTIPSFDPSGYLPSGRHGATADELRVAMVDAFPAPVRRASIYEWWQRHLATLRSLASVSRQWLGGSYVTAKPEPDDIDLCSFLDGVEIDGLPEERQNLVWFITSGKASQAYWHCDSYGIVEYPVGHANRGAYLAAVAYWSNWWGKTRPDPSGNQIARGYLEIR